MKRLLILAVLCLLACAPPARALTWYEDWSTPDSALLVAGLGATYADGQTTKDLLRRGGRETNSVYGTPHPSGTAIDQESLIGSALVVGMSGPLSLKWRRALYVGWTTVEAVLAYQNAHTPGYSHASTLETDYITLVLITASAVTAALVIESDHVLPYYVESHDKSEVGLTYHLEF